MPFQALKFGQLGVTEKIKSVVRAVKFRSLNVWPNKKRRQTKTSKQTLIQKNYKNVYEWTKTMWEREGACGGRETASWQHLAVIVPISNHFSPFFLLYFISYVRECVLCGFYFFCYVFQVLLLICLAVARIFHTLLNRGKMENPLLSCDSGFVH